ncbi:MAG: ParA family protein [Acidobacteria bacterium]|nr:ParA family protein [Acidobacteriota bacterium]MCG3193585.1 Chromosome partitioning protein ParA [Thermoanaerobaculia bacterium]MCK6684379.1 ParA family protein [Thermoanaerobaculia bacterium]
MTSILAVASNKGGVGKTTTVVNLGAALSALGHRVLLVDLDPQNGVLHGLGLVHLLGNPGLFTLLETGGDFDSILVETGISGLDACLAGTVDDEIDARKASLLLSADPGRLEAALGLVASRYDFVLIDTPAGLSPLTIAALVAAQGVLVPLQAHPLALRTLPSFLKSLFSIRSSYNSRLELSGVVITMYEPRIEAQARVAEQIWASFPEEAVFETVIPKSDSFVFEFGGGGPVAGNQLRSPGAQAYVQLAREVVYRLSLLPPDSPAETGE